MNILYKALIISLFISSSYAISEFSSSLEKRIGISSKRVEEVSRNIRIKFGSFSRGSTAAASYNPLFNTIKFNKSLYSKNTKSLKTIEELMALSPYGYQVSVATIFHELGHAELDTIIEESRDFEDRKLYEVLKFEVAPWFKKNFSIMRSWDAVHELYGYYRTSIIETIFNRAGDILLENGINQYQGRCFLSNNLKNVIATQTRDEFSTIQSFSEVEENEFKKKSKIDYIFIRGRDYDLRSGRESFKDEWFSSMWNYLERSYRFPINNRELISYIDQWEELSFVTKCRQDLWDNYHSSK